MKPYLSFLLLPALGLAGWGLSTLVLSTNPMAMPALPSLDAPPPLGVALPPPPGDGPVTVSLSALLPMLPSEVVHLARTQRLPQVNAILVIREQRLAQIDGLSMVVGDRLGELRIVGIEKDRVLFERTPPSDPLWVPLIER